MKILNVIEIVSGALNSVESFPVLDELDETDYFTEQEAIDAAEDLFLKKGMENGMRLKEGVKALVEGSWSNSNGYEVLIYWSAINVNE